MKELIYSCDVSLEFEEPVRQHSFVLRCLPSETASQKVLEAGLSLEPDVPYLVQTDGFGNFLQSGRIDAPHESFHYHAQGRVRIDAQAVAEEERIPMYQLPTKLTQMDPVLESFYQSLKLPEDKLDHLWALANAVHGTMTYLSGTTDVQTTAAEAFSAGKGVCQDYAHVFLALARRSGFCARYVNGLPEGEGSTHAWCEVWVDGRWLGIDPTRMIWVGIGADYVRFNVGRDFRDCPFEQGVFSGYTKQVQRIAVSVQQA